MKPADDLPTTRGRMVTLVLVAAVAFAAMALVPRLSGLRLPGDDRGYEPQQPLTFSHRLHAGELRVPCLYCHSGAERSRHAGIPDAATCMNCHRFITARRAAVRAEEELAEEEGREPRRVVSPELAKLYRALGLGEDLQPDPSLEHQPIAWVRVHSVPDFVFFDHRPHVAAGVACQQCHGPVETMEKVRQVASLSMGWCLECHRSPQLAGLGPSRPEASTDCASCHY